MAKIAASYNTTIAYDAIPTNREKQTLEEYYIKTWNAKHINSASAPHTKLLIPPSSTDSPFPSDPTSFSHTSSQITAVYVHTSTKLTKSHRQTAGTNGPPPYDRMQPILK